jgi:uncharacterized membrane-anchored protein YhcB (DUF1043 family)
MFSLTASILVTALLAFILGWYARRLLGKPTHKEQKLNTELQSTKQEYSDYQSQVNHYVEKTANLFNDVSLQYKKLYDHLSEGSVELCKNNTNIPTLEKLKNKDNHDWHPTYVEAREAKVAEKDETVSKKETEDLKEIDTASELSANNANKAKLKVVANETETIVENN